MCIGCYHLRSSWRCCNIRPLSTPR